MLDKNSIDAQVIYDYLRDAGASVDGNEESWVALIRDALDTIDDRE